LRDKCDVVQDLLPIYLDGELREGTKRFVEEHLKECSTCRQVLEDSFEGEKLFREVIQDSRIDAMSAEKCGTNQCLNIL